MTPNRKFAVIVILCACALLVAKESSPDNTQLSNIVEATRDDTVDCLNLYKPFPVVIPQQAESLITKRILQEFADYIDLQIVDEIYQRVRNEVCNKLTDAVIPCRIEMDTIADCLWDSLLVDKRATLFRDLDSTVAAYVAFYEHKGNGGNNISFQAQVMDSSQRLRWPRNNGDSIHGVSLAAKYHDELIVDSGGNMKWYQRNIFQQVFTDSVRAAYNADTVQNGSVNLNLSSYANVGSDQVTVNSDEFVLKNSTDFHMYDNAGNAAFFQVPAPMDVSYTVIYPDSTPNISSIYWGIGSGRRLWSIGTGAPHQINWYPAVGLTQGGISYIDSLQSQDTINFVRDLPFQDEYSGFKYNSTHYTITLTWCSDSAAFNRDYATISGKTDSLFYVNFSSKPYTRTLCWMLHGFPKDFSN